MLGTNFWEPPSDDVAKEFFDFCELFPAKFFESLSQDVSRSPTIEQLTGRDVAGLLIACISEERSASLVRLSDGEGNILSLAEPFGAGRELVDWCARRISYIHFGDHSVVTDAREFFADMIMEALGTADVLGFAPFGSISASFAKPPEAIDVRAVMGNRTSLLFLRERLNKETSTKASTAWISRDLLPHYKAILQRAQRVCVISTYDELPERLASGFSITPDKFGFISVPKQAVFIPTADRENTKHFPDEMEHILREIEGLAPNTVVLVAAGLLGKKYCAAAKRRGCVAIDIGSIAEVWLGISARGMDPAFIEKWKL